MNNGTDTLTALENGVGEWGQSKYSIVYGFFGLFELALLGAGEYFYPILNSCLLSTKRLLNE
jgi:hypothetical protein